MTTRGPAAPARPPTVVIVGGGISGLAAAWFLASRTPVRPVLLEASGELGGKVRTERMAGRAVEAGPDGFLAQPEALALCDDLGLASHLVRSLTAEAYLWDDRELRPLSAGAARLTGAGRSLPAQFVTLSCGLEHLVGRMADLLRAGQDPAEVRLRTAVTDIEPRADGTFLVRASSPQAFAADSVIIALPAQPAARLLERRNPPAAAVLSAIRYLDLAVVNLVYPGRPWCLPGSGFLARDVPGRLVSGCTWLSSKWPHLADDRITLIRATVGGSGRPEWQDLDDGELAVRVHLELERALGPAPAPDQVRITRWTNAIADHRCLAADPAGSARRLVEGTGLLLATGAYGGGGLASCVLEARRAAEAAAAWSASAGGGQALARTASPRPAPPRTDGGGDDVA